MTVYTIVDGDHISRVAHDNGLHSIKPIWNHRDNAMLTSQRPDPHVLAAGDQLTIPDIREQTRRGSTEQRHRFVLRAESLRLRIKVFTPAGALADVRCDLSADDKPTQLTTDGQGVLERRISAVARRGRLVAHLDRPVVSMPFDFDQGLLIGGLQPVETDAGLRSRLSNLGYLLTDDDEDADAYASAIEEFQCDAGLHVDGIAGPRTRAALLKAHGC
jgi:hypothetical protein